jgi:hypothetical protein
MRVPGHLLLLLLLCIVDIWCLPAAHTQHTLQCKLLLLCRIQLWY